MLMDHVYGQFQQVIPCKYIFDAEALPLKKNRRIEDLVKTINIYYT